MSQRSAPFSPSPWLWGSMTLVLGTLLAALTAFSFMPAPQPVWLTVDGEVWRVYTRARDVEGMLRALGLSLRPEDEVIPNPDTPLSPNMRIAVRRARPVNVITPAHQYLVYTRSTRVGEVLSEAGVLAGPRDVLWLDGNIASPQDPLPPPNWSASTGHGAQPWSREPQPVTLEVRRAIPLVVDDGNVPFTVYTAAPTVGEALRQAGVPIYLGDEVRPGLGHPVSAYLRVTIQRSVPILIEVDGRVIQTRTRARTVAAALAEQGVFLTGLDEVTPSLSTPLQADTRVRVTRVAEFVQVQDERLPYETVYVPDDDLELDTRRLKVAGRPGIFRRRYRVQVRNGVEVSRVLEDAWVAQEPITNVIAYGRKIVLRTLETPQGPVTYWRRIRMLATSYSASTAGVDPTRPWYGVTRLGLPMRRGIVAVDPRVVPLGTRVYVPGYGIGHAADTGSLILGRRIDLGYNDWDLVLWNRWVDVYLLAPPPPPDQINYLLPNWPYPPR